MQPSEISEHCFFVFFINMQKMFIFLLLYHVHCQSNAVENQKTKIP
ncbi:hypothetical protein HMPREF1619_00393 [Klebsiella pneumoniae 909957]|nr:hypothetical protein HMPREF1619_00393 [Klebsiella pneumoniae 909957]